MKEIKQILILEYEEETREVLVDVLKRCGNNLVFQTDNKKEASQIAIDNLIDLFVIDISLSQNENIDGKRFAISIRSIERYELTPIIFVTSRTNYEEFAFHELHCYDYLTKPINKEIFKKLITVLLKPRKAIDKNRDNRLIEFFSEGIYYPIKVENINYIRYEQRKVMINIKGEEIVIKNSSLAECLQKLEGTSIIQVNRSMLVNGQKIKSYDISNQYIRIEVEKGECNFELGRKYRDNIKEFLKSRS